MSGLSSDVTEMFVLLTGEFPSMTSLRSGAWEILLRPQIESYIFSLTFTFYNTGTIIKWFLFDQEVGVNG